MNTLIQQATASDWNKLFNIYERENLATEKLKEHITFDFGRIGIDRFIWLVLFEGLTIGSIQLILDLTQKDLANGKEIAYLHHFRVARDFWGKGFGSKLYHFVEDYSKQKGIQILTLEVEKINLKAQEIYKRWGYEYLRESINPIEIAFVKKFDY